MPSEFLPVNAYPLTPPRVREVHIPVDPYEEFPAELGTNDVVNIVASITPPDRRVQDAQAAIRRIEVLASDLAGRLAEVSRAADHLGKELSIVSRNVEQVVTLAAPPSAAPGWDAEVIVTKAIGQATDHFAGLLKPSAELPTPPPTKRLTMIVRITPVAVPLRQIGGRVVDRIRAIDVGALRLQMRRVAAQRAVGYQLAIAGMLCIGIVLLQAVTSRDTSIMEPRPQSTTVTATPAPSPTSLVTPAPPAAVPAVVKTPNSTARVSRLPPAVLPAKRTDSVQKPAEVVAPRPSIGTLAIASNPSGAAVYINRQYVGETPLRVPGLRAGEHVVWLEYEGYHRWTAGVLVPADKLTRVEPKLRPVTSR